MKVLENHFEGKTTFIIGNYISNGCQTFHVKDSERIFNKYNVPQEMREEVLSYIEPELDLRQFVDDYDPIVRNIVAQQGIALDKLMYDRSWFVRRAVAEQGYGLDELVDDIDVNVRIAVAKKGYGLEKLIKDEDSDVRYEAERTIKRQKRKVMKHITLLVLFLAQVMSFAIGFILLILINLQIPNKTDLSMPCYILFIFGTANFLLTQILLYVWDKNKNEEED